MQPARAALLLCTVLLGPFGCAGDSASTTAPDFEGGPLLARANPGIVPPQASPHGKTYSEWAAEWWQWAHAPLSINPVLDQTGAQCAVNQPDHVWFLAGSFSPDPVTRECTVPAGTALFLPLINFFYGAFLNDPPETRTEEFLREAVSCVAGAEIPTVEIDGVAIANPKQYHEQSVLFDVQLTEDNIYGLTEDVVPDLLLSPSVDEGFYLFLTPLSPGEHTIHWSASFECGFSFSLDVTYHLTVE